jgi:hypothetical protein
MILLRTVGFLVLLTTGGLLLAYLLTRDRRYLAWAGRVVRFAIVVAAIFMALYVLERLILVV